MGKKISAAAQLKSAESLAAAISMIDGASAEVCAEISDILRCPWVVLSQAVGAVMLARALASPQVRKDLLAAVKQHLDGVLDQQG